MKRKLSLRFGPAAPRLAVQLEKFDIAEKQITEWQERADAIVGTSEPNDDKATARAKIAQDIFDYIEARNVH